MDEQALNRMGAAIKEASIDWHSQCSSIDAVETWSRGRKQFSQLTSHTAALTTHCSGAYGRIQPFGEQSIAVVKARKVRAE